jgi:hypothetical protein
MWSVWRDIGGNPSSRRRAPALLVIGVFATGPEIGTNGRRPDIAVRIRRQTPGVVQIQENREGVAGKHSIQCPTRGESHPGPGHIEPQNAGASFSCHRRRITGRPGDHLTPDRSLKSLQERVEALASRHQGLLC